MATALISGNEQINSGGGRLAYVDKGGEICKNTMVTQRAMEATPRSCRLVLISLAFKYCWHRMRGEWPEQRVFALCSSEQRSRSRRWREDLLSTGYTRGFLSLSSVGCWLSLWLDCRGILQGGEVPSYGSILSRGCSFSILWRVEWTHPPDKIEWSSDKYALVKSDYRLLHIREAKFLWWGSRLRPLRSPRFSTLAAFGLRRSGWRSCPDELITPGPRLFEARSHEMNCIMLP